MRFSQYIAILPLALLLSACHHNTQELNGHGNIVMQTRTLRNFYNISVSNDYHVLLTLGGSQQVQVIADNNLLPAITTTVQNKTLIIRNEDGTSLTPSQAIEIKVTLPFINTLSSDDDSTIYASNINSNKTINLNLKGLSKMMLWGTTNKLIVNSAGGSMLLAPSLYANDVNISTQDNATNIVNVKRSLSVEAHDNSSIIYYGAPDVIKHNLNDNASLNLGN